MEPGCDRIDEQCYYVKIKSLAWFTQTDIGNMMLNASLGFGQLMSK